MKKLFLALILAAAFTGCASSKKNTNTDGITSETTATGSTQQVDSSVAFGAVGSDTGTISGLQTVNFDFDSATLSSTEMEKLSGNAKWLADNSGSRLLIEGHCDQRGSTEYNLSLGERRANAVKKMLIDLGVDGNRLSTTSFGKEKPIANGDSEADWARNRRANFVPSK